MSLTPGLSSFHLSTMINTYQTSLAPPPLPPRLNRSHPVLIPAPLPGQSNSKPLLRFLVAVAMLNLVLCVGGFIYLYHNFSTNQPYAANPAALRSDKQETWHKTSAHMVPKKPSDEVTFSPEKYLQWDTRRSDFKGINYYEWSWLTIPESGDYFVYSRVTFTGSHTEAPLSSTVNVRKSLRGKANAVMLAYCDMDRKSKNPHLCTATLGEVITLEKGNQLSVSVTDPSLVSYEEGDTTFGMYKL